MFMVALTRIDATIWDKGSIIKPRASSLRVVVDHASLLDSSLCSLSLSRVTHEDVAVWPYIVSILLEFSSSFTRNEWSFSTLSQCSWAVLAGQSGH